MQSADFLKPPSPDFSPEARRKNIEKASKMRDEAFNKVRQMKLNGVQVILDSYTTDDGQPGDDETTIHTVIFQR